VGDGLAHSMASLMVAESSSLRSDLDLDLALRALVASLVDTQGAPRRSAYFICAFMPDVPSYISAGSRAEAAGRVLVMRQLVFGPSPGRRRGRCAPGRALPRAAMPLEGARRDEKPVAGTRWPVKRRQGHRTPAAATEPKRTTWPSSSDLDVSSASNTGPV